MLRATGVLLVLAVLGGCAETVNTEQPVGIGASVNSLKRSPCSCLELKNLARG